MIAIRRVKGSFIKTKDNIRKMIDSGIKVSINTVIQRLNVNDLIDLYNIFENSHILFHAFSLYEDQNYSNSEDIIINESDEIEKLIHVMTVLLKKSINNNNNVILTEGLIYNYLKRLTYPPYIIHPGYKCTVLYRSVIVNQKGHVFPCFNTNLKKRSIKGNSINNIVFSGEYIEEIRKKTGLFGCVGCNTMCYCWDVDFRNKVMFNSSYTTFLRIVSFIKNLPKYYSKRLLNKLSPILYDTLKKLMYNK